MATPDTDRRRHLAARALGSNATHCLTLFVLFTACATREGHAPDERIAEQLLLMGERDQEARQLVVEHLRVSRSATVPPDLTRRLARVDDENRATLERLVDRHGWPRISVVGEAAARAAFLIAQHADSDPGFQARALELMRPLVAQGEADPASFALLTDRVLVARGRPQLYGTQYKAVEIDGAVHFGPSSPIADPDGLERRRASQGLPPHAEYVRELRRMLGVPGNAPPLPRR